MNIVWVVIYFQGLFVNVCCLSVHCAIQTPVWRSGIFGLQFIWVQTRNAKPSGIPFSTFLLHNFAFTPSNRCTRICNMWDEYRYAHPSNNKILNCNVMCLAVQLTKITLWGVRIHHCFPWQRKVLSLFTNRSHPPTSWLERNENKTFQRCEVLARFFVSFHFPSNPDALSHTTKPESWFRKKKLSALIPLFRVEPMDLRHKITITSTCMQPRFRFLATIQPQRFFLVLLCFCCYEPGKAGSAKAKRKLEKMKNFIETKKIYWDYKMENSWVWLFMNL